MRETRTKVLKDGKLGGSVGIGPDANVLWHGDTIACDCNNPLCWVCKDWLKPKRSLLSKLLFWRKQ